MNKYLFVINPVSGGTNKDQLITQIQDQFGQEKLKIWKTTGTDDAYKLTSILETFQPDFVAIAGGDGTINQLIMPIINSEKTLAIIPSGSANGLATDLDITLENALKVIKEGQLMDMDVIMINNKPMVHMADLGLNASLVKRYEEENRRGFIGYAISAIKELPHLNDEFEITITSGNSTTHMKSSFAVIANCKKYGTGYEINPQGEINDGKFELCTMHPLTVDHLLESVFNKASDSDSPKIFDIHRFSKAQLKLKQKTNFQIDGEYQGEYKEIDIEVYHKPVKLLIPSN